MDSSDFSMNKSPRKELQGPRPAPLKVRKESHKIKKPPLAPQQAQQQQPTQIRPPVIIYTVSPKVIHTNPSDFMNLVQRLTGSTSSSSRSSSVPSSSSTSSQYHPMFTDTSGAISRATRFATIEKAKSPEGKRQHIISSSNPQENFGFVEGIEMNNPGGVEMTGFFPGILSPGPNSLPPLPQNFFSPPSDPNSISFFHDLSPVLHGNRNFIEGSFMPSPSSFNISPNYLIPAPTTPSIDHLFNHSFDL